MIFFYAILPVSLVLIFYIALRGEDRGFRNLVFWIPIEFFAKDWHLAQRVCFDCSSFSSVHEFITLFESIEPKMFYIVFTTLHAYTEWIYIVLPSFIVSECSNIRRIIMKNMSQECLKYKIFRRLHMRKIFVN